MKALKFITCGSVDDGKSTLIGRLLVDSRSVLQDQLASVSKSGEADLALFTDGLSAEREQGITIDVAYRYFSTPVRKFIIGDAPGHVQYTRNMVTAASSADAAVVLVDATKVDWQRPDLELLPQTRRHSLLAHLLRVPSILFAVNKLDAIADPELGFAHISGALARFARAAGIQAAATVPISALKGHNVVTAAGGWAGYHGPSLLQLLEQLPALADIEQTGPAAAAADLQAAARPDQAPAFSVQWVEKFSSSADTSQGRRIFWGRVASGVLTAGQRVQVLQGNGVGLTATVARVLNHVRAEGPVGAGHGAGVILDRELDVSRGDWLLAPPSAADDDFEEPTSPFHIGRDLQATIAWLDDEALVPGRLYWALHGQRWVKAKVKRIVHSLNIDNLAQEPAHQVEANHIARIELALQAPLATLPYAQSRALGAMVLVDAASNRTSGAVLVD